MFVQLFWPKNTEHVIQNTNYLLMKNDYCQLKLEKHEINKSLFIRSFPKQKSYQDCIYTPIMFYKHFFKLVIFLEKSSTKTSPTQGSPTQVPIRRAVLIKQAW